jgi:hypothetical protein
MLERGRTFRLQAFSAPVAKAATAALRVNSRLQLRQTLPGSATGIRGWEPDGDRNVA